MKKIRVLVVDDSAFMRKVISDMLNSDDDIVVIDTARNGREALHKVRELEPDVVTLDVEMPLMDGLTCLKEIHEIRFVPVIMLSSVTQKGAEATIQALEDGAIDFITKPENIFSLSGEEKKKELIEKIKIANNSSKINRESKKYVQPIKKNDILKSRDIKNIVAIGTSTGGPKALQSVIPLIPGDAPAAFLVVQHMPPGFTKSLAERLNSMSEVTVKEAEDGETVMPGYVYIAPGDFHMKVKKYDDVLKIKLTKDPPVSGHRPSVNVMMESLSETGIKNIIAVIMTGMGGDGSEGVVKIKEFNKGYIIAQDKDSCVVYGMPKVAVQTGVVDSVVPLKDITRTIMKNVGVHA